MLDKIPLEILVSIIEYLSFEDITALTCCNRFFAQFLRNDLVWWYIFRKIENEETKKSQNRKLSVLIEKKRQPEEDLTLSQLLKVLFSLYFLYLNSPFFFSIYETKILGKF